MMKIRNRILEYRCTLG